MKTLLFSLVFVVSAAQASQVVWLTLTPGFVYKDIEKVCTNSNDISVNLGVELEGLTPTKAVFDSRPGAQFAERFFFTKEELSQVQFEQGKQGPYLKEIQFSPRVLNHLFSRVNLLDLQCGKPTIKSIERPLALTFRPILQPARRPFYRSDRQSAWGYREDGWAWNLEVYFVQTLYQPNLNNAQNTNKETDNDE